MKNKEEKKRERDKPKFKLGEELLRLEALTVTEVREFKGPVSSYFKYKLSDGRWYYEPDLMRLAET